MASAALAVLAADPITIDVDVILSFDSPNQVYYQMDVVIDLGAEDREALETATVVQILEGASRNLDDLVKISLCYMGIERHDRRGDYRFVEVIDFLCRNSGKYYFQPNQRDDYEQAIVDATGIASQTLPHEG